MATKKKDTNTGQVQPKPKYPCVCCGRVKLPEDSFYTNKYSPLWKNSGGKILMCKECLKIYYDQLVEKFGEVNAVIAFCGLLDFPYSPDIYLGIAEKASGNINFSDYIKRLNFVQVRNVSFINSIVNGSLQRAFKDVEEKKEVLWREDEVAIKDTAINIIGYDPFPSENYTSEDRRFLFQDISRYLDDDEIGEDPYKISQIIQIVLNNYQIKKIDASIAGLKIETNSEEIKRLNDLKKNLVSNNMSIAKESEISVKNKTDKDVGKSTLTYLMKDLREKDIVGATANFYDQLKSDGTFWAVDMSNKALLENTLFDENDKQEIFIEQRNLIQSLQKEIDDLKEENRLLLLAQKEGVK